MSILAAPAHAGSNGVLRPLALALIAAGATVFAVTPAHATNGYFANGYGAASKATAGAGVADGEGPLAPAQNPALGVKIGNVAGLCFTGFMPHREIKNEGTGGLQQGTFESENEFFPILCGGANYLVDNDTSVGLVAFGNGGMNTEYKTNVFSPGFDSAGNAGTAPLGIDMAQAFFALNIAHKVTDGVTLGVAPTLAIQRMKVQGLEPFQAFSTDPTHVTGKGYDWSWGGGVKLGALWDVNRWLSVGVNYQSRMWMTKYDQYAGLFAEQGDFDIPSTISEGVAIRPVQGWTVMLEHQRIFYEDIASVSNSHHRGAAALRLGADEGAGFGWNDMDIFRIGVEWQTTDALTLRTGVSRSTAFTDSEQVLFNILAPATPRTHVGAGFTYRLDQHWSVTGSYAHAFSEALKGVNSQMNATQSTELKMDQDEVAVGFSYRF